MLPIELTIVGAGAARPRAHAPTSSIYLECGGSRVLVDCGEGTQVELDRLGISLARIDVTCITHMHGDHVYGLPGLLTSMALEGRSRPLTLLGPPALPDYLAAVFAVSSVHDFGFEITHVPTDDSTPRREVVALRELSIHTLPLRHRVRCVGFCVSNRDKGRHLRPGVVEEHRIPYDKIPAIKRGADHEPPGGLRIANDELTTPPDPLRSVAYLTDTAPLDEWPRDWPAPTLLIHDATFAGADQGLAAKTGHSTVRQAAAFAKTAGAQELLLTHLSVRYDDREALLAEAGEVFAGVAWAEAGGRWGF